MTFPLSYFSFFGLIYLKKSRKMGQLSSLEEEKHNASLHIIFKILQCLLLPSSGN